MEFLLGMLVSPYFYVGIVPGILGILIILYRHSSKDTEFIAELINEVIALQQNLNFIRNEAKKKYGLVDVKEFSVYMERIASDFMTKSRNRISKKLTEYLHKNKMD